VLDPLYADALVIQAGGKKIAIVGLELALGRHLKTKLATSVSTTNLAVAFGGDVNTALLIDEPYEGFGFIRWSRIDVAQQPIQIE
jgi:hypothetical protein